MIRCHATWLPNSRHCCVRPRVDAAEEEDKKRLKGRQRARSEDMLREMGFSLAELDFGAKLRESFSMQ